MKTQAVLLLVKTLLECVLITTSVQIIFYFLPVTYFLLIPRFVVNCYLSVSLTCQILVSFKGNYKTILIYNDTRTVLKQHLRQSSDRLTS